MKKISELGLELIELEDQVLLVDKLNPKEEGYLIDNFEIYGPYEKGDPLINYNGNIIASTKPLEGLPLLVIEDEIIGKPLDDYIKTKANQDQCIGFIKGYNKAKEIYKFTEEDLVNMFILGGKYKVRMPDYFLDKMNEIIQSLTKKELCIEVETELDAYYKNGVGGGGRLPKITNNQIKGIWK